MEDQENAAPHDQKHAVSSSPPRSLPNHGAVTLPSNSSPNGDDRPIARQKRKRTSPEDQAVLEAYYVRDPKPDKTARLELVNKVALGEKEVQIWFQNRRQSSRRKSRPLLPHEIAQYQIAKSGPPEASSGLDPGSPQITRFAGHYESNAPAADYSLRDDTLPAHEVDHHASKRVPLASSNDSNSGAQSDVQPLEATGRITDQTAVDADRAPPVPYAKPENPGARVNLPVQLQGPSQNSDTSTHARPHGAGPNRRARKSSSFVRLSLNSEGGAEVVAKDSSSPSPPRPAGLPIVIGESTAKPGRLSFGASVNSITDSSPGLQRAPSGRSRDSRAWEFWCDKNGRSELEDKAEKDASGRAADAIQLLRSTSGRSILAPLPSKRNAGLHGQQQGSAKRIRTGARMPLQRSSTTNGRLQGKHHAAGNHGKPIAKLHASKSALSTHVPGNESDKENWSPTSDLPSESAVETINPGGTVAHEKSTGLGEHIGRHARRPSSDRESIDPDNDPEIAAFMNGGRDTEKYSDHEELDCVQGLLSLSQGNWR